MLSQPEVLESPEVRRVNFLCAKNVELVDRIGILRNTISIQKDYIHELEMKIKEVKLMADYTSSSRIHVNFTRQEPPPGKVPRYKKITWALRKFWSKLVFLKRW